MVIRRLGARISLHPRTLPCICVPRCRRQEQEAAADRRQAGCLRPLMPIHTHADLAPVHCGRHLHPDAARDQAQGHFVRPSGVLLRGLEHERVVLAGSPSWAAPHRRAQLQVTRRRRRSTWACCAQPPSSSSSAPRRRRSPRRRGRRSPLGLPKDSYQSAKTELCVCVCVCNVSVGEGKSPSKQP